MVESSNSQNDNRTAILEDTVRNLREENAKLMLLLRSQGLLVDSSMSQNDRCNDTTFTISTQQNDSINVTIDRSDITLTSNSISTTNKITHQHANNQGMANSQAYNGPTLHGGQSNTTPNFNNLIQTTSQPVVQNGSNTLVQNNTNLIQPINLVNFNNVNLDSLQTFLASQNNVVYLSQSSSTPAFSTNSTVADLPGDESTLFVDQWQQHPLFTRSKPSSLHQRQELVPVVPKIRREHLESIARQFSSTNDAADNNADNNSKGRYLRPIRIKLSSRANRFKVCDPDFPRKKRSLPRKNKVFSRSSFVKKRVSKSRHASDSSSLDGEQDSPSELLRSKAFQVSVASANKLVLTSLPVTRVNKTSTQPRPRGRKKKSDDRMSVTIGQSLNVNTPRPIGPKSFMEKRSTRSRTMTRRKAKSSAQFYNENTERQNSLSPMASFAESISGLLENLDKDLIASNFLAHATSNLFSEENNMQELSSQSHLQQQEIYNTIMSMPTLDEFNRRLENNTPLTNEIINELHATHDCHAEHEQMASFMNEEDMCFVEMNFDENVLRQFDFDDPNTRSNSLSNQNILSCIVNVANNNRNNLLQLQQQPNQISQRLASAQNVCSVAANAPLTNKAVFTTLVPIGSQQKSSKLNALHNSDSTMALLPDVTLTERRFEPIQVATYESVEYQNILDDLVMVTDQDVLQHVQATVANDTSIVSTDFPFSLLEVANDVASSSIIQTDQNNAASFIDLQCLHPAVQDPAPSENGPNNGQILANGDPEQTHLLERLQSEIRISTDIPEKGTDHCILNTPNPDLSSVPELRQIHSSLVDHEESRPNLITPTRPLENITEILTASSPINSNCEINQTSEETVNNNNTMMVFSPIAHTPTASSNSFTEPSQPIEPITNSSVAFEPVSPLNPSSQSTSNQSETIIDSGHINEFISETDNAQNDNDDMEELLRDATNAQYEIVENQGQTAVQNPVVVDNVDQLMEQIEMTPKTTIKTNSLSGHSLEKTFLRYKKKHLLKMKYLQYLKFKILQQKSLKSSRLNISIKENHSPPPAPECIDQENNQPLVLGRENPVNTSSLETRDDPGSKTVNKQFETPVQTNIPVNDSTETESTNLSEPLQSSIKICYDLLPPTVDESIPKREVSSSPLPSTRDTEAQTSSIVHSGFMIDEQTPPSSITSTEPIQSPPPLLIVQPKSEKCTNNYSHLFEYHNNNVEHQSNTTFVTPPPEIDSNLLPHRVDPYDNLSQVSDSSEKRQYLCRKSSVASSTSSKSSINIDYTIDAQELEPVSPTPLSKSKQKRAHRRSSSSSSNHRNASPLYTGRHQQNPTKDHKAKKSSSKTNSSQLQIQSHSSSNHNCPSTRESPNTSKMAAAPPPTSFSIVHIDPYSKSQHHSSISRTTPSYINYSLPDPLLNHHPMPSSAPIHSHSLKHQHHTAHPARTYPTHWPQQSHHIHSERQQHQLHHHNSNHLSSRDNHLFNR